MTKTKLILNAFLLASLLTTLSSAYANQANTDHLELSNALISPMEEIFITSIYPRSTWGRVGYDISKQNHVGVRFTPEKDYYLDNITVTMMSNTAGETSEFQIQVYKNDTNSAGQDIPSDKLMVEWTTSLPIVNISYQSVLRTVFVNWAKKPIHLKTGKNYWVVLSSDSEPVPAASWNFTENGTYTALQNPQIGDGWHPGTGAAPNVLIRGVPAI